MTSNESQDSNTTPGGLDDPSQIKRKLAWRMGIAGMMIVALLGGLELFDYLAAGLEDTEPPPPRFTEPVPVPKKSVAEASGPVTLAPLEEEKEEEEEEKEIPSVPESSEAPAGAITASPPADPTPPPEVLAAPETPAGPVKSSAGASTPSARPSSRPAPARPSAPAARTEQKGSPPGLAASRPEAPKADRIDRADRVAMTPMPISPRQPPLFSRLPASGYTFQSGVFADTQRAEDVHARLVLEGIPATLETRVVVGPFKNRNEAEAARVRMQALGIDVLPIPKSGKK
jgi:DedD protein